jgi:hypothetical protein
MATATTRRRITRDQIGSRTSPRPGVTQSWKVSDAAFVATLQARGVTFALDGENLRVDAPRGTLSDFDRERLWQHLDSVRSVLAGEKRRATTVVG